MTITEDEIAEPETQTISPDEVAGQGFDYSSASGVVEPGNIDLTNRPKINNPDGTVSTERSFSIGTDKGEVLIPEIVDGKRVTKQEAIQHYKDTGQHLGIFKDVQSANTTAEAIHNRDQSTIISPDDVAPTVAAPNWLTKFDQFAQRGVRRALNLPVSAPPSLEVLKEQGMQDLGELTSAPQGALPPRPDTVTWGNLPEVALHDAANFLGSPAGVLSPALGLLPKTGQALVSAGFGAQMMTDAIQKVREGRYPEAAESAIFGALGAHGAKEAITPEKVAPVAPPEGFEVTKTGVTEPPPVPKEFLPEVSGSKTADLTLDLVDARKNLLSEAQQLQEQAKISMQATGQVHPAVQERIDAINEELNHPTVGVPVNPDTPVEVVLQSQGKPHTVSPDEVEGIAAESPASTASGEIATGQQQVEPPGEIGVGTGPEGATVRQGSGVPVNAGMSRATIEEQIARGVLPEDALVIGEGWNPTEAAAVGDRLVNEGVNPDMVLDALQGKRKLPDKVKDFGAAVAVLQSESRRLAAVRADVVNRFGIGSPEAKAAQATENHWLGTARPQAGGLANRIMRAFEDTTQVDLGTYDGLYGKAAQLLEGRGVPEGQQIEMVRRTKKVQSARGAVGDALTKRDEVLDRTLPKVKEPTSEEIKAMFDDLTEKLAPCQ